MLRNPFDVVSCGSFSMCSVEEDQHSPADIEVTVGNSIVDESIE